MSPPRRYALLRPELLPMLQRGERAIGALMAEQAKALRAGEVLIEMGEDHDTVYRVRDGWFAQVRSLPDGRNQIIDTFLPGDFFAVKTLFLVRQSEAVQALTAASVEFAHCGQVRRLSASNHDVALRLMWQILEDERRLHAGVVSLGRGNADERMAQMLLEVRERLAHAGSVPEDADEFPMPMTQQHMSDLLGISEVHVNRVLRRFREQRIVTIRSGRARVLNERVLEALAYPMQDAFERDPPEAHGGA